MEENETAATHRTSTSRNLALTVWVENAGVFCHPSRHGVRAVWSLLRGKWLGTQTGCVAFQKQTGMSISRAFRKFVTSYFRLCSTVMVTRRRAYLCCMPKLTWHGLTKRCTSRAFRKFVTSYFRLCSTVMVTRRRAPCCMPKLTWHGLTKRLLGIQRCRSMGTALGRIAM